MEGVSWGGGVEWTVCRIEIHRYDGMSNLVINANE